MKEVRDIPSWTLSALPEDLEEHYRKIGEKVTRSPLGGWHLVGEKEEHAERIATSLYNELCQFLRSKGLG